MLLLIPTLTMTVAELIKKLQEIEDSSKEVLIQYHDWYETMEEHITYLFEHNGYPRFLYISVL